MAYRPFGGAMPAPTGDHASGGERRGNHWSPALAHPRGAGAQRRGHTQTPRAAALPFRGGKPLRRRQADEGISPYKGAEEDRGMRADKSSPPVFPPTDARSKNGALVSVWQKMSVTR